MKKYSQIITEAKLNLSPEQKKRRSALKQKRNEWLAKGKDVSSIDAEIDAIENSGSMTGPTSSGPSPKPSGAGSDWDEGYKAAIEAIKKAQAGENGGSSSGGGAGMQSGLAPIPSNPDDMSTTNDPGSGFDGSKTRRSRNGSQEGQGVVRPEDCTDITGSELDKTPGTAGGMISGQTGNKISEAEGHEKNNNSDEATAQEWAKRAQNAAKQMGKNPGYERLKAKFDALYKATKDWKKELKKVVGQAITPEDPRQAYANKNILISQDRIARTNKDKYDSMSFMMAAIDTSGSMSQDDLNTCLNEVYQVALAKKPLKLIVVQFDTRIADIQEFRSLAEFKRAMPKYEIKGGGGTDVKPVWDLLKKDPKYNRVPCDILMVFTDGYLEQYKRDPKHMKNLCWVVIDNLSFDLKYKDITTKCVRILKKDMGH